MQNFNDMTVTEVQQHGQETRPHTHVLEDRVSQSGCNVHAPKLCTELQDSPRCRTRQRWRTWHSSRVGEGWGSLSGHVQPAAAGFLDLLNGNRAAAAVDGRSCAFVHRFLLMFASSSALFAHVLSCGGRQGAL